MPYIIEIVTFFFSRIHILTVTTDDPVTVDSKPRRDISIRRQAVQMQTRLNNSLEHTHTGLSAWTIGYGQ